MLKGGSVVVVVRTMIVLFTRVIIVVIDCGNNLHLRTTLIILSLHYNTQHHTHTVRRLADGQVQLHSESSVGSANPRIPRMSFR